MTFIKECKPDFKKLKEPAKSRSEVECTGKCYGCQAECINRIPKLPEGVAIEILSFLEARKIALQIREKFPEETIKEVLPILETIKSALEEKNDR